MDMLEPQPTLVELLVRHVLLPHALLPQIEINSIVFRVDPYAGDPDPEKKSLQLCRRSSEPNTIQHLHGQVRQVRSRDTHPRVHTEFKTENEPDISSITK